MEIIPAIDIIDGKCVRLTHGDYDQKTIYNDNPVDVARTFEDAGLERLHLVDLDGAKAGEPCNIAVLNAITSTTRLIVDYSGGIRHDDHLQAAFDNGAHLISLGSIAVKDEDSFLKWLAAYSGDRIILSADVRDEKIAISGWQEDTNIDLYEYIGKYLDAGVRKIICTDIGRDGAFSGPATQLYTAILKRFPTLELIASGGISSYEDIQNLSTSGVTGVIIGKAIYEGRVQVTELGRMQC